MKTPETTKDKVCREFRYEAVKGIDAMMKTLADVKEEIERTNALHDSPPPVGDDGPIYCGTAFSYEWTRMLRERLESVCYPLARCNGATMVRAILPENAPMQAPAPSGVDEPQQKS